MTELNEYESEMLDIMLQAFGTPDSLTRVQLMELFDQDESTAFAMVQILTREGCVAESGKHGDYELPEKLILKPKGDKFLKEGGFVHRHKFERDRPIAKLQQQNMKLQNIKLANESRIFNLQTTINTLQTRKYIYWVLILIALVAGYFLGHTQRK
jgi:hypothetical protein